MSAIPPKIQSFFDHGFLPGGGDLAVPRSFDSTSKGQVSLNCISKIEGITTSLLHKAKGGLTVTLEEKIGEKGILDAAVARNEVKISEEEAELAKIAPSFAKAAATQQTLEKDQEFLAALSAKVHKTALFVLNIELVATENESMDGCKEVGRPHIPPDQIDVVFISDRVVGKTPFSKVVPVPSTSMTINFSYKDEQGNPQTLNKLGPIEVPDYREALLKLSETRGLLSKRPLYTHMTRLWDPATS